MVSVTVIDGSTEYNFAPIAVSSISLPREILGSAVRAIDGTLLSYISGAKRETNLSVIADISVALAFQEMEAAGKIVELIVTDHNGVEVVSYSGLLSGVGVDYSQAEGMASLSFSVREV